MPDIIPAMRAAGAAHISIIAAPMLEGVSGARFAITGHKGHDANDNGSDAAINFYLSC